MFSTSYGKCSLKIHLGTLCTLIVVTNIDCGGGNNTPKKILILGNFHMQNT